MRYSIESILPVQPGQEYIYFWGHQPSKDGTIIKSCFSQWWFSDFIENEITYKTAEHYMMAKKAELFGDFEAVNDVLKCSKPQDVKKIGRRVKDFDEQKWNDNKYDIVLRANYLKFDQDPNLQEFLMSTNDKIIVEASPYDKIWGVGQTQDDPDIKDPQKWKGENLLGFALMEVRDELIAKN